jgi:hypothetical protein
MTQSKYYDVLWTNLKLYKDMYNGILVSQVMTVITGKVQLSAITVHK